MTRTGCKMLEVEIPYGRSKLTFRLPEKNLGEVLMPNSVDLPTDGVLEIEKAIDAPIGAPPPEDLARGRGNALILCDDITRPTPAAQILPILIDRLNRAGILREGAREGGHSGRQLIPRRP